MTSEPVLPLAYIKTHLAGLVLAGGQSRRMGVDKTALKPFGSGGCSMLARSYALVSAFARPAFVSSNGPLAQPYPRLPDAVAGFGPAAGVCSGLRQAAALGLAGILVLPCDLPLLSPSLVRELLACHFSGSRAATFFQNGTNGRIEPLVAVYGIQTLKCFEDAIARGEKSLRRIVSSQKISLLPYGPHEAGYFLNCNFPADMSRVENFRL